MNEANTIADTLKILRKRIGYTQKELAEATGISLAAIIAYENRKREPNSKNMAILERFFHVSGAYLRGEMSADHSDFPSDHVSDDATFSIHEITAFSDLQLAIQNDSVENQLYYRQILTVLKYVSQLENDALRSHLLEIFSITLESLKKSTDDFSHQR